jgi:hypothetical protein
MRMTVYRIRELQSSISRSCWTSYRSRLASKALCLFRKRATFAKREELSHSISRIVVSRKSSDNEQQVARSKQDADSAEIMH